jgi:uncharacterized protein with PIN domain
VTPQLCRIDTTQSTQPQYIRCDQCRTPIAEVQNGALIIRSRHMGGVHVTVIPLERLTALLAESARRN